MRYTSNNQNKFASERAVDTKTFAYTFGGVLCLFTLAYGLAYLHRESIDKQNHFNQTNSLEKVLR